MKVFIAGAVGKRLIPALLADGHQVTAMTRSASKAPALRTAGAVPVVADGLARAAVLRAVTSAAPEVVIHQMTGLAAMTSLKRFDEEFTVTNRLRTEGTDHLLAAARAAGLRRVIAQSYGNWNYARTGTGPAAEEDPFDPSPPAHQRETLKAIQYLEDAITQAAGLEGLALRYGNFYGPGTGIADDGDIVGQVRKRRLPIVGDGAGVWSFVHVHDAAAAVGRGAPGVYNIADDEPAPVSTWLPELAMAVGGKPPRRVPVLLGHVFIGAAGVSMMTQIRGASNAKAARELGWKPWYQSWRDGFRTGLRD